MGQKHAYLIMAHNKFGQLGRLLKALDNEDNTLFVHIDKKCKAFDLDILNELKAQVVKSNIYIYITKLVCIGVILARYSVNYSF